MLSVAKLRVGQEAYQLSGVAQSLDDYYTGAGEAAGRWAGVGAEMLGLDGEVDPDDLRAVLAGLAPGTGGLTPNGETLRHHPRRVPGFDLTFKAPKSVSVLYAVSDDPRVQAAIVESGEAALRDALAWIEREAINVRRGTGNQAFLNDLAARDPEAAEAARIRSIPAHGLVAAAFRHRTSRAGDPLLHWHTLVANLAPGPDGRWTAFVHPDLYRALRAGGEIFQASLRAELTTRLGLTWRPGRHVPEIAGVPAQLCEQFSKRSQQIADWLEATGTPDDRAGRQAAVLATRQGKPEVEHERFDAAWKVEASAAGWGPAQAEALISASSLAPTPTPDLADDRTPALPSHWIDDVGRTLTESDSTFTRPQLAQAVAARLPDGAPAAVVDRLVAQALADRSIVPIRGSIEQRWSTLELLAVERRFLDSVGSAAGSRSSVPGQVIDRVIDATPSLGDDQADAARLLASTTDGVSVLVGPAGTGKTFTVDAIRAAHQAVGHRVVGAAPSARAAHELATDAHIPASTLHRLLGSWSRGYDLPGAATVLVIDEAAMAGVRELEAAVSTVLHAGGRVLLVGDHHQLPEVTSGGGFAALATDPAHTVAHLTVNRRQHEPWEITALAELRDGHVPAAVKAYRSHGRVVVANDRAAMVNEAIDRWLTAHAAGHQPVLIAGTNATVDILNQSVRRTLRERGRLTESVGRWGGRDFAIGDRVVLRINDYTALTTAGEEAHVLNGQTATLVAGSGAGAVVQLDHDHREIHLSRQYLDAGGLDHAYALTAHRAQGGTWDLAIAVGADGLYREAGYLVLSRGRQENWLILTPPEADQLDAELSRHDSALQLPEEIPDVDDDIDRRLATSRAKRLALVVDPDADRVATLADMVSLADLETRAAHARQAEHRAGVLVGDDPADDLDRIDRATHTATHAAVGVTVKALDRNNIGTITALDDQAGTVRVLFIAVDGRQAERDLAWGDVRVMDAGAAARTLPPSAQQTLDVLVTPLRERQQRWQAVLAERGVAPGERASYERAASLAIDRAASTLAAAQPEWLHHGLGPRPSRTAAKQVWDDAIRSIATYRTRYEITDPTSPLGPRPILTVEDWEATHKQVAGARLWIETYDPVPAAGATRSRFRRELVARESELDAILATAPADQRDLIAQLRDESTLPYENVSDLLTDALATQDERRRWILEHWPHIVEYAEVRATLDTPGPDARAMLDDLAVSGPPRLAEAAQANEPWLARVLGRVVAADEPLTAETVNLLNDVAAYRERWEIDHPEPLDLGAWDPLQAAERQLLAAAVVAVAPDEQAGIPAEEPMELALRER